MTPTILSHRPTLLKTLTTYFGDGYRGGGESVLLQVWTNTGRGSITLDRAELRALLRELPAALLLEVLGERGLTVEEEGEVQAADLPL